MTLGRLDRHVPQGQLDVFQNVWWSEVYGFHMAFVPFHQGYQGEIAEGVTTGYSVVPTW